ncbi:S1 family peptidase [Streptomyces lunaelactis]|uniref:S1 family peptidase n=1 Tax=Streptomyces lunaelactis TaxID=1535768 RepID=UPI00131EEAFE|nr:S1 family peptidase [Streptomyces lunaelactis]NUK86965.1 hypothetical protein [Streptomyces lunaelactis]
MGRHRKPSAKGRPGLASATAGGLLYGALFVSGASAVEQPSDAQSTSTEDIQPGTTEQPSGDAESGTEDWQPTEDSEAAQVNEVDEEPDFQITEGTDTAQPDPAEQPEEGQSGGEGQQPSSEVPPGTDDQEPVDEAQPSTEDLTLPRGAKIIPRENFDKEIQGFCTAGIHVTDGQDNGFLTAGHCKTDDVWVDEDRREIGKTQRLGDGDTDWSFVETDRGPGPKDRFSGVGLPYVGREVCKSGAKTGEQRCGKITKTDETIPYDDGTSVRDLIVTDIESHGGDSGGPLYDKNHPEIAIGTLSGGNGDMKAANEPYLSYYVPAIDVMVKEGFTLPRAPETGP